MFQQPKDMEEEQDAIIVENVSKRFRIPHEKKTTFFEHISGAIRGKSSRYEEFLALKDVSFRVKKGETLGIIGENGSGKSTLLKIIAGVLSPDSGYVKVNGKIAPFLELGVGFQPELTAEDNVRLYGAVMGMSKKEMEDKFEEIFEFAELQRFRGMKLKNFSSGMYARLAFATAVATEPEVLLIDEVLAVGDEAFQKKCLETFNEFKRDGKTIVLVSHSLESIKKMCKEAILLSGGKLISKGDNEKVTDDYLKNVQKKRDLKLIEEKNKIKNINTNFREIEIKEVKLFDNNMNETYSFNCGDELIIRVKYGLNKKVIDPLFQIQIFRDDGILIHGMNTGREDIKSGEIERDGEFEYAIKGLSLLEGTYFANIGIVSSWTGPHYDYHSNRYKFIVRSKKSDGAGITSIGHVWKLEK